MTEEQRKHEAIACFILSKRQSAKFIAFLTGHTEELVEELIAEGERIYKERSSTL